MSLTNEQRQEIAVMRSQGETDERIAKHYGVEVKELTGRGRKASTKSQDTETQDTEKDEA